MYNTDMPARAELPTTRQLIRSTVIAVISAIAILIAVVLPSEYGIDPTGIGRTLGLTEMGEIKAQLSREAEADRQQQTSPPAAGSDKQSSLFSGSLDALFIRSAEAQTTTPAWNDEISITLTPGQGTEVKLVMKEGAVAEFEWMVNRGVANYDLHGDGGGNSISYKKGRGVSGEAGSLKAAFDGNHGWFWRNRTKQNLTVTLRVRGDYSELKKML